MVCLALFSAYSVTASAASFEKYEYVSQYPAQLYDFTKAAYAAVDDAGYIYVTVGDFVEKYDSAGALVRKWGGTGAGYGQFKTASGIAVDSKGRVIVVDTYNNRVQIFNSEGIFKMQIGVTGSGGCTNTQLNSPRSVAVDKSDNIYVADADSNRVMVFKANDGSFLKVIGQPNATTCFAAGSQASGTHAVAVDQNGNVYVSDNGTFKIHVFDANGTVTPIKSLGGGFGSGVGQFHVLESIAIDDDGTIYVTDPQSQRVQAYKPGAGQWEVWGAGGFGKGLTGISIFGGAGGTKRVATVEKTFGSDLGKVRFFEPSSQAQGEWTTTDNAKPGGFSAIQGISLGMNGEMYVAESGNKRIQKLKTDGTKETMWNTAGPSQLLVNPAGIAINRTNGAVWVSDGTENKLYKYNKDGQFMKAVGGTGVFAWPSGLDVDSAGNVVVVERGNSRLQVFSDDGNFLYKYDSADLMADLPGQTGFLGPADISVASSGYVYVLDTGNNRVVKLQNKPEDSKLVAVSVWQNNGISFDTPAGIAVDEFGNVYIADTNNHRIIKQNEEGEVLAIWGSYGAVPGEFESPLAVAVNQAGVVYVADGNRIQLFSLVDGNADLKDMAISAGALQPAFAPGVKAYAAAVENTVNSLTVSGSVYGSKATMQVEIGGGAKTAVTLNGGGFSIPINLSVGDNKIAITVTSSDKSQSKEYTLIVTRAAASTTPTTPTTPSQGNGDNNSSSDDSGSHDNGSSQGDGQLPAFSDVDGHWAKDAIAKAAMLGITSGYADGTFKPERQVTRGEFIAFLARAFGWKANSDELSFTDKDTMAGWVKPYVTIADEKGISAGYEDGSFRPNKTITRAEAAVMAAKAIGTGAASAAATTFADDKDIPSWARGYVQQMVTDGLLHGRGENKFAPAANLTRAEAVVLIISLLDHAQ